MVSKIFRSALIILFIGQQILAFSDQCPDPTSTNQLADKIEVHEEAPFGGRIEKTLTFLPTGKSKSCVTFTGLASAGPSSAIISAAIGFSDDGIKVSLVSAIKAGIDGEVAVYTD